ncbi:hypothetical protein PGQ11_001272 [Apiospora arundinis]|uniref:Uncharacterized protein n=1 Tax=Apiospora arundinis TaxID=335852 RepID=A0ABR2JN78_9PEZI
MAKFARTLIFFAGLALATAQTTPRWLRESGQCRPELITEAEPRVFAFLIPAMGYGEGTNLELVHDKLRSCPNIRTLHLTIDSWSCDRGGPVYSLPLDPLGGTKYAAVLESLELRNYNFADRELDYVRRPTWKAWRSMYRQIPWLVELWYDGDLNHDDYSVVFLKTYWMELLNSNLLWAWAAVRCSLPGAQCRLSNLELWTKAMDFSKLQHLALYHCTLRSCESEAGLLVEYLVPKLSTLTSLRLTANRSTELFLALGKDRLKQIAISTNDGYYNSYKDEQLISFDDARPWIEHHAGSLTSLEWRTHKQEDLSNRPMIPLADLRTMRTLAPNLQELSTDVDHNDDVCPWDTLDAIAEGAPTSLNNLTLHLDLSHDCTPHGTVSDDDVPPPCWCTSIGRQYREPPLTVKSAEAMCNHLVKKADDAGTLPGLTTVVFKSGWWENVSDYNLYGGGSWLQSKIAQSRNGNVTCTVLRGVSDDDGSCRRHKLGSGQCALPSLLSLG